MLYKTETYPGKCFWTKEKEPRLKFNPGVALIGLWTTGPRLKFSSKLTDNPALWLVPAPSSVFLIPLLFSCSEQIMRKATNIARENLISVGTCIGKFTKTKRFRLHVTALDFMAPYAKVSLFFFLFVSWLFLVLLLWSIMKLSSASQPENFLGAGYSW